MIENKDIQKIEHIKYSLREKEQIILNSQIKQNKIENKIKRLEATRKNIINNKKNKLLKLISFIIYNVVMLLLVILFISNAIKYITSSPLLITSVYVGVLFISGTGAYLSSKIDKKIKKYYRINKLNVINNKIKQKQHEMAVEISMQNKLKKEITTIINYYDNITPEVPTSYHDSSNNIIHANNIQIPKVRSRIKHNKKY